MIDEIQKLLDRYIVWLKDKTTLREIDGLVEITSPYLDRHNDYLQIYVKKHENGYLITDDGYIIDDLNQSGCKLDSPKRLSLLKTTLAGFGINLTDKGRLEIITTSENFSLKKHNLIQAMLSISDMFVLAEPMVSSLFYEDVTAWLDLNDIRYTPKVNFRGKSGFEHHFDFVIPKSRKQPERILLAVNRPNRDMAEAIAFRWIDTKEVRAIESKAYALLNDQVNLVAPGVIDALNNYGVTPVPWSGRDKVREDLVA
ncbi:MAG: DUF1829 domain-containing protein [Thermodesulfovibrionales bacterium]|nr:DUF1829 domain-containing protein [Thermodesulfovibrionales bacterium]